MNRLSLALTAVFCLFIAPAFAASPTEEEMKAAHAKCDTKQDRNENVQTFLRHKCRLEYDLKALMELREEGHDVNSDIERATDSLAIVNGRLKRIKALATNNPVEPRNEELDPDSESDDEELEVVSSPPPSAPPAPATTAPPRGTPARARFPLPTHPTSASTFGEEEDDSDDGAHDDADEEESGGGWVEAHPAPAPAPATLAPPPPPSAPIPSTQAPVDGGAQYAPPLPAGPVVTSNTQYVASTVDDSSWISRVEIYGVSRAPRRILRGADVARVIVMKNGMPLTIVLPYGLADQIYADCDRDGQVDNLPYYSVNPNGLDAIYVPTTANDRIELLWLVPGNRMVWQLRGLSRIGPTRLGRTRTNAYGPGDTSYRN